ncbi:MAG: hypothetical protein VB078_00715 [Clostridiaceae bacterium]|nr:hypothetical protein [Clostridiaceae bacterium]
MEVLSDTYEKYIKMAKIEIKEGNYSKAEENIKRAMLEKPHSPEAHNLYGHFCGASVRWQSGT